MSLTATFDPRGADLTAHAHPIQRDGATTGLALVLAPDLTIQSRDTDALRRLAAKLIEAADLADAITALALHAAGQR